MPAITYEIGGKNTKLRESLRDSKAAVADFRNNLKAQTRQMHADAQQQGAKGGIFGAVLGGNLAAQGIGKIVAGVGAAVTATGELQDASEQLGISAETIARMGRVMEGSGVKTEELRKAFQKLNDEQSAVKKGSAEAAAKFAALGLTANEVSGMKLDDLMFSVADGLHGMSDEGLAASAALDLIGSKQKRMVDTLRQGGAKLRTDMAGVSGAVSDANNKAVDDTVDAAVSGMGAVKGMAVNAAGAVIGVFKTVAGEYEKGMAAYAQDGKQAAPAPQLTEAETKAAAQAAADEKRKAFEVADKKRLAALDALNNSKRELELDKEKEKIGERRRDADKERADILRSTFSQREKFEITRANLLQAEKNHETQAKRWARGSVQEEEASAVAADARAKFEAEKQKAIERAGLPLADQQALARADKEQERARTRAERTFSSRERDRIDRQFRQGKISKNERDAQIQQLGVGKENEVVADLAKEQLGTLKNISVTMKHFADLLVKI